jgi:hypothetical protein
VVATDRQSQHAAIGVALLVCFSARPAAAQAVVEADARTGIYEDTDATRIITTTAKLTVSPIEQFYVGGHYLADVVSSASVDVVSAATGRWEETRHEGQGTAGYRDADRSASASYIYSVENDWRSHTGSLALSHDTMNHQLTLGVSGAFGYNEVGRADDLTFDERMLTGAAHVEAAIVASPHDVVGLTYSFNYVSGYQASPYRYVRFESALSGATLATGERVPDQRARNAFAAKWNHHLVGQTFLRTQARAYLDNWGVTSGTAGAELVQGLVDVIELGVFVRGYLQSGARFYRAAYSEERTYMTSDRELSPFVDAFGGLRLGFDVKDAGPFRSLRGDVKGTALLFHYFDFPQLTDRYGVIAELGLGASL